MRFNTNGEKTLEIEFEEEKKSKTQEMINIFY